MAEQNFVAECCICLQAFDEHDHVPRVIACGHTLCTECCSKLVLDRNLRCPECAHLTRLVAVESLPRNIELMRLAGNLQSHQAVTTRRSTKREFPSRERGFVVLENLGLFPKRICIMENEKSVIKDGFWETQGFVYGKMESFVPSQGWYHVSLLELGGNAFGGLGQSEAGYKQLALSIWGSLPRECKRAITFASRLTPLCRSICPVLGFWLNDEGSLYFINRVGASSSQLDSVEGDARRVHVALQICEVLMELHGQAMVCGVLGPESFCLDDFGRVLFHWNGASRLVETLNRSLKEPHVPSTSWEYISPEMLRALEGSSDVTIDSLTDAWSVALLVLHLLYNTPARSLSFEQACEDALQPHEHEPRDSLEALLWTCLDPKPNNRASIVQIWHELQLRAFQISGPLRQQDTASAKMWCFGLAHKAPEVESELPWEDSSMPEKKDPPKFSQEHTGQISSMAIFGRMLVTASFDKTVRVWNLEDGAHLWVWEGHHSQRILSGAADTASNIYYTGDYGKTICAWRISEPFDPNPIATWQEHTDWKYTGATVLLVSPSGFLYSGSGDRTIKVWSLKDYTCLEVLEGHRMVVSALMIDGDLLYSGSWDTSVRVWELTNHRCINAIQHYAAGPVRSLTLLHGGSIVVAAHDDGTIWLLEDGTRASKVVKAHDDSVTSMAKVGELLVTSSWDKSVRTWKGMNITQVGEDIDPIHKFEFSHGVTSMIAADGGQIIAAASSKIEILQL